MTRINSLFAQCSALRTKQQARRALRLQLGARAFILNTLKGD